LTHINHPSLRDLTHINHPSLRDLTHINHPSLRDLTHINHPSLRDLTHINNSEGRLTLVVTFPYTPIVLTKNMMHDDEYFAANPPTYDMTPRAERHAMWMLFVSEMRKEIKSRNSPTVLILDVTPVFEEEGTTDADFQKAFMKDKNGRDEGGWNGWTDNWLEDNHPDFIKTQGIVAEYITALKIPGLAPKPSLTDLYPCERRHVQKPFW